MQPPALDRAAQRRAGAEQRALADELVERPRAHPRRERGVDRRRSLEQPPLLARSSTSILRLRPRADATSRLDRRRRRTAVSRRRSRALVAIVRVARTVRVTRVTSPTCGRRADGSAVEPPPSETVELLQRLIRFDTVNPPGNERAAQEHLAGRPRRRRLRVRAARAHARAPEPRRARSTAPRRGPVLCLLSHVDTVLATPSEWTHDPWSGDLADGFVWGRGALDMKSQTAAEVVAACSLARAGWRPARGSLLVVALVDEETGGADGAQWLTAHAPRQGSLRLPAQRGRRRLRRVRRPPRVLPRLRREGRLPLRRCTPTASPPTARCRSSATTRCSSSRRSSSASRRASRRSALTEEPRAFLAAIGALGDGDDAAAALERVRGGRAAAGGAASSRCSASRSRRRACSRPRRST